MAGDTLSYDVVVLGGGFAGVYAARALKPLVRGRPDVRVALVADENYMVFQPMLPEVAGAAISPRHVVNPLRQLVRHADVLRAKVTRIDPERRTVRITAGDFSADLEVAAKDLVVTLGAEIDLSRVPGMPEHALLIQNVGDAMKLRARLIARFEEANLVADEEIRARLLTFVVVGGGYSGVETAGQILDLFASMERYYRHISKDDFRVVLVHSRDHLLPTLSQRLGAYAERKLRDRGLEIILEQYVTSVTANQVYLSDGTVISTNTVVSTVGNAPHAQVRKMCDDFQVPAERGRIKTTRTLAVEGWQGLWAAGDCAWVPMEDGSPCPATAQFAMRQGKHLGVNLVAHRRGRPLSPFAFKGLGELATIGHRNAVANVMGMRFSGFLAWWMWRTVYLGKLPGLDRKVRVIFDWTLDLFFPRDINLLSPRYSTLLKQVHLEPGNVLFNPGEPAFSLYVVREGGIDILDGDRPVKKVAGGEFFGERALLADRRWRYRAVATEPTTLVALSDEAFRALAQASTSLRHLFERSARKYLTAEELETLKRRIPDELRDAPAHRVMNTDLVTFQRETPISEVLRVAKKERRSSYPVLHDDGRIAGVLNVNQLYDFLTTRPGRHDEICVADVPWSELPIVRADLRVAELVETFLRSDKNKILVEDEKGRLAGVISVFDLVERSGVGPFSVATTGSDRDAAHDTDA